MVKKTGLFLALVLAIGFGLVSAANYVFAGGPGPGSSSTETAVAVIGENVQMSVWNPFQVTIKWTGITLKWEEGKVTPVYPGQVIGNGEITITNVSQTNQAAILSARPIKVAANTVAWPSLEVTATSGGVTYYPWQQIVVAPGSTMALRVEVRVAYGGPVSSPFNGVELVVTATPLQNYECCG